MAVDLVGQRGQYTIFLILLVLGGHVCIPLMLFTIFFSRGIVRHPLFINFCFTWAISSLSYSLLLYAGQSDTLQPPSGLCLTQAAMVYASPAMTGLSSLFLTLHIYLMLKSILCQSTPVKRLGLLTMTMIITPYIIYFSIFTMLLIYGRTHPQLVYRSVFYCTMRNPVMTNIGPALSASALFISLGIEILTIMTLRRHWRAFSGMGRKAGLGVFFIVRSLAFTIFAIGSIMVSLAFITELLGPVPNVVIACLPLVVFLTFGTQDDFLRVWGIKTRDDATDSNTRLQGGTSDSTQIPLIFKRTRP